jgi:hypothetical protein
MDGTGASAPSLGAGAVSETSRRASWPVSCVNVFGVRTASIFIASVLRARGYLVRLPGNQAACEHRQMQLSTTFDLEDETDEDAA